MFLFRNISRGLRIPLCQGSSFYQLCRQIRALYPWLMVPHSRNKGPGHGFLTTGRRVTGSMSAYMYSYPFELNLVFMEKAHPCKIQITLEDMLDMTPGTNTREVSGGLSNISTALKSEFLYDPANTLWSYNIHKVEMKYILVLPASTVSQFSSNTSSL